MPLFGHTDKTKRTTDVPVGTAPGTGIGRPHESTNLNTTRVAHGGYNEEGTDVTGTGILGQGQGRHHPPGQPGYNNASGNAGYGVGNDPMYHGNNMTGARAGGDIPPTGVLNSNTQPHGGSGHAFTGKVERVVGSMVGSEALKAKGLQKEQEANMFKVQGAELAEAERLEREALMRRERAVGHGAHPDNKHLGAGFTGHGGTAGGGMSGGY